MDKAQVVARGVVLGKLAMRRPREPPDREIEPGRAELPLVIAVGRELLDRVVAQIAEHVNRRAVDRGASAAGLLVGQRPRVTQTGEYEAVPDSGDDGLVASEPGDRSYGPRDKEEPVRVPQGDLAEMLCEV